MRFIYPGSFDPITLGHLDIIKRSSLLCDELNIGVLENPSKKYSFSTTMKVDLICKVTKSIGNVKVIACGGLLIDIVKEQKCDCIIKGMRTYMDYELEKQMAGLNYDLGDGLDTVFLTASTQMQNISSTMVREIGKLGGSLSGLVPDIILEEVTKQLKS